MYAIEFRTTIENNLIKIPEMYRGRLHPHVRVILLEEQAVAPLERCSIEEALADAPGQRLFKSAESVTAWLHEERGSLV